MINTLFIPELQRKRAYCSSQFLARFTHRQTVNGCSLPQFPDHFISKFESLWSPQSSDTSASYFLLWDHHKSRVYQESPHALNGLRNRPVNRSSKLREESRGRILESIPTKCRRKWPAYIIFGTQVNEMFLPMLICQ